MSNESPRPQEAERDPNLWSDVETIPAEWWWVASYFLFALTEENAVRKASGLPAIQLEPIAVRDGITISGYIGSNNEKPIVFAGIYGPSPNSTIVQTSATYPYTDFWEPVISKIIILAKSARDIRRATVGYRFDEILDTFYAERAAGRNPNLRIMAEEAGVKYGSLRQHKIKYDRTRREVVSHE